MSITKGPDGALWFTSVSPKKIGRVTTNGDFTLYDYGSTMTPANITLGSDGNLWFTLTAPNSVLPGGVGRITPSGTATTYSLPAGHSSGPGAKLMTAGPDGALWFIESYGSAGSYGIGRVTTSGTITEYPYPTAYAGLSSITSGPDGALWVTETGTNLNSIGPAIGRFSTSGTLTRYPVPSRPGIITGPAGITTGPNGNLWFTGYGFGLDSITTSGQYGTLYKANGSDGADIIAGPDQALWYAAFSSNAIGRVSLDGTASLYTIPTTTANGNPYNLTIGPDNNIWFTEYNSGKIGRLNPTPLPAAPTNLTAASPTKLTALSWNAVPAADLYLVYRNGVRIGSTISTTYVDSGISNGTYSYYVSASNSSGEGASSNTISVTVDHTPPVVLGNPDRPPNAAGWYNGNVTITWTSTDPLPSSGTPNTPAPTIVAADGSGTYTSAQSCDPTNNCSTGSLTIKKDSEPPTISFSLSSAANSNGWQNSDVTVSFSCNDFSSGIASCSAPTTLGEGTNQVVTGTAIDVAGNTSTKSVVLNIDKGKPTIAYSVSPLPNSASWSKANTIVAFTCMDSLSGIASCPNPQTISTETSGQVFSGTATDKAGNSQTTAGIVRLDKTAPTIGYTAAPAPNANGWTNDDVTVTFNCSDNLSGIASCSDPVTLHEGDNQTITGTATDVAGNVGTVSFTARIDKGKPTITGSASPAANNAGWNNSDVTVGFDCADILSGLVSCTSPQTITNETNSQTITGTAVDQAGNSDSSSITVKLDKTDPTISYSLSQDPNGAGWHNGDVTVTFACDDNLSGVASCTDPVTLHEGANQVVTGVATDVAGNTKSVAVTLNVDKTAPTITSVISPAPNAAGWHKSDVLVGFNCADTLSGVASCTDPQTISTETAGQTISGNVADVAGNTASASATVKLDKTAPTIGYHLSKVPNSNGWNNEDVLVSFDCDDNLSGVANCSAPVALGEGANQTVVGNVSDAAGNTNSVSVTLNIDKGLPTITSSVSPAANAAGWHNSDTTVSFTCDDPLSGIDNCTAPQTITGDTAGLSVTGQALDKAGNIKTTSETVKLDKTAPTINYTVNHTPNANNWNKEDVTVTFACADSLSGVVSCSAPVTLTQGEAQTVTGTAVDVAGNAKTVTATINIDETLPTISSVLMPSANAAGWHKADVTVGFNCADTLSGIDSCTDNQVVSTEGANNQVTGAVVDKAGNTASTTATVKLDKTAPTIAYSLSTPPNGNGWNNGSVTVSFSCADSLSGVANCSSPITLGEGANQSVTGTATDVAGNVKTVTVIVNVDAGKPTIAYTVSPVPNAAGWNKANATVTFTCMDSLSGIASCTSPQTISTETAGQTVNGTATDLAGNSQSVSATVKLDKTAPTASGVQFSGGLNLIVGYLGGPTGISATVSDNLSGLNRVEYYIDTDPGQGNGTTMTVSSNTASWSGSALPTGQHDVYVRSQDVAGNWSTVTTARYNRAL